MSKIPAEADHAARIEFLTGPAGIRPFVAKQYRTRFLRLRQLAGGKKVSYTEEELRPLTFTVEMLASALSATHSEVEEALSILRSQDLAIEMSEKGHWDIRT